MDVTVKLETGAIELQQLLKLAGVVGSGGQAKHLVQEGHVTVNGACETRRAAQVRPGDVVEVAGDPPERITVA